MLVLLLPWPLLLQLWHLILPQLVSSHNFFLSSLLKSPRGRRLTLFKQWIWYNIILVLCSIISLFAPNIKAVTHWCPLDYSLFSTRDPLVYGLRGKSDYGQKNVSYNVMWKQSSCVWLAPYFKMNDAAARTEITAAVNKIQHHTSHSMTGSLLL